MNQKIIDSMPCAMAIYSYSKGAFSPIMHNSTFWDVMGYAGENIDEVTEKTNCKNVHPEDKKIFIDAFEKASNFKSTVNQTIRLFSDVKNKDIWLDVAITAEAQPNKEILYYVVYTDISEHKQAESDVNSILNNILNNMSGGLATYEIASNIKTLMYTDGVAKMLGFTREEYDKLICEDAINGVFLPDRARLRDVIGKAIRNNASVNYTYRVICKGDFTIWANLSAFPSGKSSAGNPI